MSYDKEQEFRRCAARAQRSRQGGWTDLPATRNGNETVRFLKELAAYVVFLIIIAAVFACVFSPQFEAVFSVFGR